MLFAVSALGETASKVLESVNARFAAGEKELNKINLVNFREFSVMLGAKGSEKFFFPGAKDGKRVACLTFHENGFTVAWVDISTRYWYSDDRIVCFDPL